MNVGDLIKFDRINGHTSHINNKHALYLGEEFIHRDDGVIVENHKVLLIGDSQPILIDKNLLKYIKVVER